MRFRFEGMRRPQLAYITVDGIDCPIEEPSPFSSIWYSHKLNAAGQRYKIGICIQSGKIVWVNGSYPPGPWPDLRIFRHRLIHVLLRDEWIVADRGYREGLEFVIYKGVGPDWYQDMMAKSLARHEAINSRFKRFNILSTHYRHDLDSHETTFAAIACVVQVSLEVNPAFRVVYDDTHVNRFDFL
jgi:DDE superfamily endonuclease